jgi:hypothetical protein
LRAGLVVLAGATIGLVGLTPRAVPTARAQQVADTTFDVSVAHPAYTRSHPRVVLDEAHQNFHTAAGRYRPFARLLENDGCLVVPGRAPFAAQSLAGTDVLVIANALAATASPDSVPEGPAFKTEECDAVRAWVAGGGALLLIADHAPFGAAAADLAARFGVDMSQGYTADSAHADPVWGNPTVLLYTREDGLLAEHPITAGRDSSERVRRVVAFTGQSLKGPAGSAAFLVLGEGARDLRVTYAGAQRGGLQSAAGTPAAGRAQGLALRVGKGRVVVLGEAAMLSAQLATLGGGGEPRRVGMNRPGLDNKQLALNIIHWLTGVLD